MRIAVILLTVMYPFAIYYGLQHWDIRYLVLLLLVIAGLRLIPGDGGWISRIVGIGLLALLVAWTWLSQSATGLKLYPVVINVYLLMLFGWTLARPPSMIERFARRQDPELNPQGVLYTRRVTQVWCGFFVFNIAVATWTALLGSDAQWALYNGFIAYVLMGLIFLGEWLVRRRVMADTHQ